MNYKAAALAALAIVFFAVSCENINDSDNDAKFGNVSVPTKGKTEDGVYVKFIAGAGNKNGGMFPGGGGGLNIPLGYKEIAVVKCYDTEGLAMTEKDFLDWVIKTYPFINENDEVVGKYNYARDGYDFIADMENLRFDNISLEEGGNTETPPKEIPENKDTDDKIANNTGHPVFVDTGVRNYKYFVNQVAGDGVWKNYFDTPVKSSYIFASWKVLNIDSVFKDAASVGDEFDTSEWNAVLEKPLLKKEHPYITLEAVWTENPELETSKGTLKDLINTINTMETEAKYKDDYVVGAESDDKLLKELQAKIKLATELLSGTEEEAPIDMAQIEGLDNVEGGESDTEASKIKYVVYDIEGIKKATADIEEFCKREDLIVAVKSAGVVSLSASINYPVDDYNYTSVTIANDGLYEIELWGASGGPVFSTNGKTAMGGKGGRVKARFNLKGGDVLKFFLGGEGEGSAVQTTTDNGQIVYVKNSNNYNLGKKGGLPNGGNGDKSRDNASNRETPNYAGGSGGGGSTDVRLLSGGEPGNIGLYSDVYMSTLDNRIIVAGGGGGAAQAYDIGGGWPGLTGGDAGEAGYQTPGNLLYYTNGSGKNIPYGSRGNETLWSESNIDGKGINAAHTSKSKYEGPGGGGGGYYGGGAGITNAAAVSGGGGTNYIDDKLLNDAVPVINSISDSYGNGRAVIKWVNPNSDESE
ncbi:MAG: hypothetical protein LBC27_02385 [Spirochaetaceae bacterium]|jgi:hypothetical protein|nr:hypothetical protein [Spirochaetaceae bacterium]